MALNVEGSHFAIADFDAFGIAALVDVANDGEAGIGSSGADQLNDDLVADERFAAPVLGDIGKEAVLDAVPFTGAGWQMVHGDGDPEFIGNTCNSRFHKRTRLPLLPPQSALIRSRLAVG